MRGIVVDKFCTPEDLALGELPDRAPGDNEVVMDVRCAGVNFPDTLIIQGKYQFKPEMPFAPGGECSGVVSKVGAGVKNFKVGDRVLGMTGWGSFAEQVIVPAEKLIPVPAGVDDATASGVMMTYGTTYHAFEQRAQLQPGETVLVLGAAGGVGIAAVDIAKAMGAKVIAAASTQEKLEVCRSYGADHLINYAEEDLKARVREITKGRGVDVVYDPVGDRFAEPAVRSLAWKGRYLVIGFAAGEIPRIPLNLALLKGASIVGVFWGAFTNIEPELNARNIEVILDWVAKGKIKPLVTQTYPLKDAGKALRDLMDRKVKGKAVLICSDKATLPKSGAKL
ncbi:Quinone oxidoreductase-like protein 2-like [Hondaea fermentalgiana]|uniref:Quinone oxidoreductase-like protein 2-like n=1 Tax=Hondaea fermentalgiana TaxID=2315210 RepID=A0A2R5GUM8_9STRA|nr:Quinone oxidoreductase-like protein 2-like [Hondaea fermentalgiana]|eukprot:GBG34562.1 Quinone oxidoreductase-like protein 2-like [Hondaea fermentalgiana]